MQPWQPDELDALRRQVASDAIEAGARDAVERLVEVARQQLAAGMLPAQVMGDLLASVTTAQQEDDAEPCAPCRDGWCRCSCCRRPDAAGGVEVIAAGAVVMIAQDRIERARGKGATTG